MSYNQQQGGYYPPNQGYGAPPPPQQYGGYPPPQQVRCISFVSMSMMNHRRILQCKGWSFGKVAKTREGQDRRNCLAHVGFLTWARGFSQANEPLLRIQCFCYHDVVISMKVEVVDIKSWHQSTHQPDHKNNP